ncbi:MAG: PAS domain S-box protein [Magnetococcales bacterium]|nr:PAS domain S-box protein [Magnetococcales bacterium]
MLTEDHKLAKVFSITKPVLILLIIAITILLSVFITSLYFSYQEQESKTISNSRDQFKNLFSSSIDSNSLYIEAILASVAKIELLQQLYSSGDRDGLFIAAQNLNTTFNKNLKITHFYFHDAKGVNFLRVHHPTRFGDTINRTTMERAKKTKKSASGVELGPLGTLTLRVVHPWVVRNRLIGFIEMGQEIDILLSRLQKSTKTHLFSLIEKSYLDQKSWITGMKMLNRTPKWDLLHRYVLSGSENIEQVPNNIYSILKAVDIDLEGRSLSIYKQDHNQHYFTSPITDIKGETVGLIIGIRDESVLHAATKSHLITVVLTCIVVGSALMLFFYIFLKRVENNLQQTHNNLERVSRRNSLFLESAGDGIYGIDEHGVTTFINHLGAKLTGWNPDEIVGKHQHDMMHHTKVDGSNYPREQCPVYATVKDGKVYQSNDEIFWRKDGSSFHVEYVSTPIIEEEKIVGAVVVFSDISKRKLAEQTNQRLLAMQGVLNVIYQISFENISIVKQLDSALEAIMSIPWLFIQSQGAIFLTSEQKPDELKMVVQKGLHDTLLTSCASINFGHCICGRAAQNREIVHAECIDERHDITFDGIKPHGHYAVPLISGQKLLGVLTLYLAEGHQQNSEETNLLLSVGNSLASMIDRHRGEAKLRNMNHELEKRVQDRTIELEEYVKNLKQAQEYLIQSERMAALGGLVAGVAHEIKTPVGTGYTSSAHLQTETKKFKEKFESGGLRIKDLETYLEEVDISTKLTMSNLKRAAELVQSFKSVAVDQTSQERRKFNLKTYIDEVILSLRPKLKQTKHTITVICPDDLKLNSYPGALSQILTNLVVNSLIYGFEGIESGEIVIKSSAEDGMVSLLYSDNGVGMNEKTIKQIYEPFFTTKRNFGGSGLGMHIVFNLVTQRLNGTIICESAPNNGTTFTIKFPKKSKH